MSLKSLSRKLYLGIAVAALVMWVAGVSGGTILTLAAIGVMVAVHAGHSSASESTGAAITDTETRVGHQRKGGCH